MDILCDLTEFMSTPHRTGIQRVSNEIVSRWKDQGRLTPIFMTEADEFVRLPDECFDLMKAFFHANGDKELSRIRRQIEKLTEAVAASPSVHLSKYRALFNPEVFFCTRRVALYEKIADRREIDTFFIIYDFLPWILPQAYPPGIPAKWYPYFRLMRSIPHLAYISEWSRQVAEERVFRDCRFAGVTIPLGADGLGSASPDFDANSCEFSVIGTVEPRKGHLKILDAFQNLWREGHSIPLTFVGRLGWLSEHELGRVQRLKQEQPLFCWHDNLTDPLVAEVVKRSRATIYISEHEGFGLPPVESLSLGTPVIVSSKIPSVDMIPPLGQVRLDDPTPAAIQTAVLELMDDAKARAVTEEIRDLHLLTWDESAKRYSDWIEERLRQKGGLTHAA